MGIRIGICDKLLDISAYSLNFVRFLQVIALANSADSVHPCHRLVDPLILQMSRCQDGQSIQIGKPLQEFSVSSVQYSSPNILTSFDAVTQKHQNHLLWRVLYACVQPNRQIVWLACSYWIQCEHALSRILSNSNTKCKLDDFILECIVSQHFSDQNTISHTYCHKKFSIYTQTFATTT